MITTTAVWLLALLLLPLLLIWHFSKSKAQRITEQRHRGWTWKQVADYWHCSPSTARRWATA